MFPIDLERFKEARKRINPYIYETPLLPVPYLNQLLNKNIWMKCENLQVRGSFKIRGATNCVLSNLAQAKTKGIVTASAGNHAQGVAAIAQKLGIKATIVMPTITPSIKVQNTRAMGATVKLGGEVLDESFLFAEKLAQSQGFLYVHPYLDPHVVEGQGSVALELMENENFKKCEAVLIPIGGGGLAAGCTSVLRELNPNIKIYGVVAENAPTWLDSFKNKSVVQKPVIHTLADGVATKKTRTVMLEYLQDNLDGLFAVKEETISHAVALLAEQEKMIAEGAGALPVGALIEGQIKEKNVCFILSGGNIDLTALSRVLYRGLVNQDRLIRLVITISDLPGGLHALTGSLSELGANILQVFHHRATSRLSIGETDIEVEMQTKDKEHTDNIIQKLKDNNWKVKRIF